VRDLSAKYAVMQGAMAASERIFQLSTRGVGRRSHLEAPRPEMDPGKRAAASKDGPAIELVNVQFSYGAEPVRAASICACRAADGRRRRRRPAAASRR